MAQWGTLLTRSDTGTERILCRARTAAMLMGLACSLLLGGCHDAHPLYGPNTPRNSQGTPVDPIYGTPIPGAPQGNSGM